MEKRSWYLALQGTALFIRQGRLSDFNQIVSQAPCRYNVNFQWGVCRQLGEIATNPLWDTSIRQQAVKFLGELYRSDIDWKPHGDVKRWILTILVQISTMADLSIRSRASELLNSLRQDGTTEFPGSYPLSTRLPLPAAFPLLTRVQNIPQVEYKLQTLKMRRLEDYKQAVYIAPMAKPSLQAPDDKLFPLLKNVEEFLAGEGEVMLILGDSGAGKSTFNRHLERQLWQGYKTSDRIPLFINLPSLERPEKELVVEQLRFLGFSEEQTLELKEHRHFILICDGYDESQLKTNLHTTNYLNQDGQWSAKLIITCRTQYLVPNYHSSFMPQTGSHYDRPTLALFQEAVIAPFSKAQIEDYVEHYVPPEPRTWVKKDYMDKLTTIPNLLDLVKNPLLLTLCLEALPSVVKGKTDLSTLRVTRVQLYDNFVEHWLEVNKRRLERQKLSGDELAVFIELDEEGFEMNGLKFQQDLAAAIFTQQEGRPVVDYIHRRDERSWKSKFFRLKPEATLLRGASLLSRAGAQYRFVHRSVLEYFYSCTICPSVSKQDEFAPQVHFDSTFTQLSISDHPLSQRNLVAEPSIVQFLSERVPMNMDFKQHLHDVIELSKTNDQASRAAANAITILARAGVLFNGADLRGVRIPSADLSGGQFDSAQLQGADLAGANLTKSWIRQADFRNAGMDGVQFGELPYLDVGYPVRRCAFAPDGNALAMSLNNGDIRIYSTSTWTVTHSTTTYKHMPTSFAFSLNGELLISRNAGDVRVWNYNTDSFVYVPRTDGDLEALVAFSPTGEQLTPDYYTDIGWAVRPLNSQTGSRLFILHGHTARPSAVVYSSKEQSIASGDKDGSIRIFDTQTGLPTLVLESTLGEIGCIAYSPDGRWIVAGHVAVNGPIRLWETATGAPGLTWHGHAKGVHGIDFSPNGQLIASFSGESVKLWDAKTGTTVSSFTGHSNHVNSLSLAFSPDGVRLAIVSHDRTVRLWEVSSVGTRLDPHESSEPVTRVAYSPDGRFLISGSQNGTVRQYDADSGALGQDFSAGPHKIQNLAISADGCRVAIVMDDSDVTVWDAGTGNPAFVLLGHTDTVRTVAFSPCGHWIATGGDDKTVRLWEAHSGQPGSVLEGHANSVQGVAFFSSGQQVVSRSADGSTRVWEMDNTGECRHFTDDTCAIAVAFSPSTQQVGSYAKPGTMRVQDGETGKLQHSWGIYGNYVHGFAFSTCGQWIAAGTDDSVLLFSKNKEHKWKHVHIIRGVYGKVGTIAWKPQTLEFVTGCEDGSIRVWKLRSGPEEKKLSVQLVWGVGPAFFTASGAVIADSVGLSDTNLRYLSQRGAKGGASQSTSKNGTSGGDMERLARGGSGSTREEK